MHNISGYRFSEPSIIPIVSPTERIKRTVINRKTGLILASTVILAEPQLTKREKEILILIRQGFLSKEIAYKLNLSIYTVNNHRKNILIMRSKLSIRRKISVFSIDYDIQSKPLANIDMIAVIFHPLGLNPFVRCAMSELYNHFSAEKVVRVSYVKNTRTFYLF